MVSSSFYLSFNDARKLILHCQQLPPVKPTGSAVKQTLSQIEHLGYIQIDTISVIQRAHHHTLWNRNPLYKASHIDTLLKDKAIFEYWSHAASYLPMKEYRYSLIRKNAILNNEQKHWYDKNIPLMDFVLKRIEKEGPLMAKDFEHSGKKNKEWSSSREKQALESLFMQGDLMISSRHRFQKVYDLTQNILPQNINTSLPSTQEYTQFLITKYLKTNAIATADEITYLLKNIKKPIAVLLEEMYSNKTLLKIAIKKDVYYALPQTLDLLNKPLRRSKCKILSPFDNLLIQRKRIKKLFNFDYKLECYTPKEKRRYGYFVLPILWDGKLVARMDCKADKKSSVLLISSIFLENELFKLEAFAHTFYKELLLFCAFNDCDEFHIDKTNSYEFTSIMNHICHQKDQLKHF